MKKNESGSGSIDKYISGFPYETQIILKKIRDVIGKAAPGADETISYAIPTFIMKGNLVHFAAYKNHIGFYPAPSAIRAFNKELSSYKNSKGAVQFPLDEPIPLNLISRIVKFRVNENLEKAEKKKLIRSKAQKNLRACSKGHKYYKSSECPACPVCEKERKPEGGFLSLLSAPGRRALENKGITNLHKLSGYSEEEILKLHGMGPGSIPKLRGALKKINLSFKKKSPAADEKLSDKDSVNGHIEKLDPQTGEIVQAVRKIFLSSDKKIGERIKWNNPSFYYTGEMKPSDPKEYKREIAVFNLYKGRIMLVFPDGARVKDAAGLLEGDYKDGRRILTLKDLADLKSKEKKLSKVIKEWIRTADKF